MGEVKNENKRLPKFVYPLAVLGVSSMLIFGAVDYVTADDYDVIHTEIEDSVENTEELPTIHYIVAGGEPRDVEYDYEIEGISHFINTTKDEDYTIEGIGNVSKGNMDLQYEDVDDEFTNNSLIDYGYIGFKGEGDFVLNSEDLIGLELGGNKTEHIAEYNEDTGKYELLSQRGGAIPIEELEDSNLALITFIEKEDSVEDIETDESNESTEESEDESESVEIESEEGSESEENESEESDEDGNEEDNVGDEESESEMESESEDDPEENREIDTTEDGGTATFLGDEFRIVFVEGEDLSNVEFSPEDDITEEEIEEMQKDKYIIEGGPDQLNALTEDIGKPLSETRIYTENGIETAQDLYDTFGFYNIPDTLLELYRKELDENGDGIMGNAPDKPMISGISLKSLTPEEREDTGGTVGNPGLGDIEEENIDEEELTPDDFDLNDDKPEDWEEGNQEYDESEGYLEDDEEVEDITESEMEDDSEYELDDNGNITIEDDDVDEAIEEEETDDTQESEEETEQLKEEHEDLVNQEDEVVDDGLDYKEIGGEDVTDKDNDTEGVVVDGDDFEDDLPEEETDLDENNNSDEGNDYESGEDEVVEPETDDSDSGNDSGNDNGSELEDSEIEEEDLNSGGNSDSGSDSNEIDNEGDSVIESEEGTEGEEMGNESNTTDEVNESEDVGTPVEDIENENIIETIEDDFDDIGISEIGEMDVIVEIGNDGNVEVIRDSNGNVLAEFDYSENEFEILDSIDELNSEEIDSELSSNGITFLDNETSSSLVEKGVSNELIQTLENEDKVERVKIESESESGDELPDTGISNVGYTIPIGFTLIVLGAVGMYVSRQKVTKRLK